MDRPDGERWQNEQVPGAPSDNDDLLSILAELAADGFAHNLFPTDDGELCCGDCDHCVGPEGLTEVRLRRLEGASDPDDMVAVVSGRCPKCEMGGVVVLSYGPGASIADARVLRRLPS